MMATLKDLHHRLPLEGAVCSLTLQRMFCQLAQQAIVYQLNLHGNLPHLDTQQQLASLVLLLR